MNFRLAKPEELKQLAQLRWDFREEGGEIPALPKNEFIDACVQFLEKGMRDESRAYWVAEENGEIISHIFVQKFDLVPRPCRIHDQCGCVTNNYTRPGYRGQGIGSTLMQHVKQWAKEQDLELLITWPSDEAIRFYERAGFNSKNEIMELKLREY